MKDSVSKLSAERVWAEIKKLLSAPDPSRALLWMRQTGVLTVALPESEKWGIDAVHGLVNAEQDLDWTHDPLLRLMAIIPPAIERVSELADRLKISNRERERLEKWATSSLPDSETDNRTYARKLYFGDVKGMTDRLRLALASARSLAVNDNEEMMKAAGYSRLLDFANKWEKPVFPVTGAALLSAGIEAGPDIGKRLTVLEEKWVAEDFQLSKAELLASAP
jgi:tRNA nucleotidyltransferase/poly(A) polymerase